MGEFGNAGRAGAWEEKPVCVAAVEPQSPESILSREPPQQLKAGREGPLGSLTNLPLIPLNKRSIFSL